jgi:hypothetical protein
MRNEQKNYSAVIEFYRTQRLRELFTAIKTEMIERTEGYQYRLNLLINEVNDAIDLIYGKEADHEAHYRLVPNGEKLMLTQYYPASEREDELDDPDFIAAVSAYLSQEYPEREFDDEETFVEDEDDLWNDTMQGVDEYGDVQANQYENSAQPVAQQDLITFSAEAAIPPGMMQLMFQDPHTKEVAYLYLPHIPLNFPIVLSLFEQHSAAGNTVHVFFSEQDFRHNLILPIDPLDPTKPMDPRLN